jgi:VanZ family protein
MFFRYNKWALLWALFILVLCGIPGKDIPHISFLELLSFDKWVHAGMFFVLILFTIRGFVLQQSIQVFYKQPKLSALIICVCYGALLEIMQGTLFEERSADVLDFIANSFGCIIGIAWYKQIETKILSSYIK